MPDLYLSRIRIYPIKACAGTDVQEAQTDERGLHYDRRWMLVNTQNADLHQFDHPRLANIVVALEEECLRVEAPNMSPLRVPLQPQSTTPLVVTWHKGRSEALPVSTAADAWFEEFLGVPCQLVFLPTNAQHRVEEQYALDNDLVGFTGFQYHLLGEGSLDDLNGRLATPVPLERFRPNLVIGGTQPFAEDYWRTIQVNQQTFHSVRPCDRCAITTVDPAKGVMTGKEPLSTLARYRTFNKNVLFGQYFLSTGTGVLRVGDIVHVLEEQEPRRTI